MAEHGFKNLDDAAADLMLRLILASRSYPRSTYDAASGLRLKPEQGGVVFENDVLDNLLYAGLPQTSHRTNYVNIGHNPDFPTRALVHTHQPTPGNEKFSDLRKGTAASGVGDIQSANEAKKPIFMSQDVGSFTKPLLKYDPASGKIDEDVLAQFPIERMKEYLLKKLAERNPIAAGNEMSKRNGRSK